MDAKSRKYLADPKGDRAVVATLGMASLKAL